jgi:AcrR family transcriptional regulator
MSMEAVAAEAGVGKATLYRRYRNKADLATEAVANLKELQELPDSDDLRADLVENLRQLDRSLAGHTGMSMVGTLLVEEGHNPELLALWRERVIAPRSGHMRDRLREGIEAGEIRSDLDPGLALEMMVGAYYARYLRGEAFDERWAERVVATIWPALVTGAGDARDRRRDRAE